MSTGTVYHSVGPSGYIDAYEDDEVELSDEEIALSYDGHPWIPEPEAFEDFSFLEQQAKSLDPIPPILPSQFTEFAFRMPRTEGQGYASFDFGPRRHMRRLYDTPAKRVLLFCARQVEKSTLLGNRAITYSCMISAFRTLYVSPSATQTKTFSVDRVKEPLETSEVLKLYTTSLLQQNVFEKQFVNRSKITLRYAFLNADRARGIPAYAILLDEFQDILSDCVPVIEQAASHAPEHLKRFIYAGTPKGLDNVLEYYRSGTSKGQPMSTMGEWVVPCDRHGGEGGRYWNVLGEKNIQRKGLSCEKCHKPIDPMHIDAQWAQMQEDGVFESYRIPQLMVPWKSWDETYLDYGRYDRAKFYNEVLGISYDSGLRPLTRQQVRDCCSSNVRMHPDELDKYKARALDNGIFAGLDHGCHDEETRILTENGFKYFKDLGKDERVAQWDPNTREMTFVIPSRYVAKPWSGELRHFTTAGRMDILVTPDHRMRMATQDAPNDWVTLSAEKTAARGGNIRFVGYVNWTGEDVETFTLPGEPRSPGYPGSLPRIFRMDDWVELMGDLLTEGGLCITDGRPYCIKMSQRARVNPENHGKMTALLQRMQLPYSAFHNEDTTDTSWAIYGKQYWAWFRDHIGLYGHTKRMPRELLALSKRQLKILFDAMVAGDGTIDTRPGTTSGAYYSTSKGLCEDFQELCVRLGLRAQLKLHKPAIGNYRTRWRVLWSEGRDHQLNTPSRRVSRVPYSGNVYCVTVPSGFIVTERNGCVAYQGNTGENSYSVLSLGTYVDNKFRIFYIHRFTGEDVDPVPQFKKIDEMLSYFNVRVIGSDYGGGFHTNDHLVRKFGYKRVQKYQYLSRGRRKILWNPAFRRWQVVRTEVMSDIFNAIKRKQIEFPRWEEFEDPYANDMLNIYSEYNETIRATQYRHRPDKPDDAFHSILYCFLGSMIVHPRPDIIMPRREVEGVGPLRGEWSGPVYQG